MVELIISLFLIIRMKYLHSVSWILTMVGAVNWGLIGLGGFMMSDWNVIHMILGSVPTLESLVYVLVGAAAVYEVVSHKKICTLCMGGGSM